MQSENRILGNQLVVMSREDLDALVNEMAQNIVAAQTKNAQNDLEAWMESQKVSVSSPVKKRQNYSMWITPRCSDGTSWDFFVPIKSGLVG